MFENAVTCPWCDADVEPGTINDDGYCEDCVDEMLECDECGEMVWHLNEDDLCRDCASDLD